MVQSENSFDADVVIVGGSLSGAFLAHQLGRRGLRVLIIEQRSPGQRKACGEGLSYLGIGYLKAAGLWTPELEQRSQPYRGYAINQKNGVSSDLAYESERCQLGVGILRTVIDAEVLSKALALPSVELLRTRVLSYQKITRGSEEHYEISCHKKIVTSKGFVLACGHESSLLSTIPAKKKGEPRYGVSFWMKGSWQASAPERVSIFHKDIGQFIITPLSETMLNVSVMLSSNSKPKPGPEDLRAVIADILESQGFTGRIEEAQYGAAAINSSRRTITKRDPYLIGDAIERIDPIGGMGMTHGLYTASLALGCLIKQLEQGKSMVLAYQRARLRGVVVLRLLTALSYSLNVSQSFPIRLLVRVAPATVFRMLTLISSLFPEPALSEQPGIAEVEEQSQVVQNHFLEGVS